MKGDTAEQPNARSGAITLENISITHLRACWVAGRRTRRGRPHPAVAIRGVWTVRVRPALRSRSVYPSCVARVIPFALVYAIVSVSDVSRCTSCSLHAVFVVEDHPVRCTWRLLWAPYPCCVLCGPRTLDTKKHNADMYLTWGDERELMRGECCMGVRSINVTQENIKMIDEEKCVHLVKKNEHLF